MLLLDIQQSILKAGQLPHYLLIAKVFQAEV